MISFPSGYQTTIEASDLIHRPLEQQRPLLWVPTLLYKAPPPPTFFLLLYLHTLSLLIVAYNKGQYGLQQHISWQFACPI